MQCKKPVKVEGGACLMYRTNFNYGRTLNMVRIVVTVGNNVLYCVLARNDGGNYGFAQIIICLINHIQSWYGISSCILT